ncbi:hypothetical protein HAX54_019405, partial [Datura stramonium]|nr:hypothetical protein [Datura stramonium]
MPPQTMQTWNGPRTPVQGSSVGAQNGPTTSCKSFETPVPQPPSMGTSKAEFIGEIQMLTQLVAAQLGRQNSTPASLCSCDSGALRIKEFLRMNSPMFTGSK